MLNILSYMLCGLLGGIISGMGMGGGTLLIPLLTIFMGDTQLKAQGSNIIAYLCSGGIAHISHKKSGKIDKKVVKTLFIWGIAGAIVGTYFALTLDETILKRFFGAFIIVMAAWQLYIGQKKARAKNESNV